MLLNANESQLVLIDYQEKLMPAIADHPAIMANALRLAQAAQALRIPIWGTEQNPSKLGANIASLRSLCQHTVSKMRFSAAQELLPMLQPPPKPAGNARSLPRHLQRKAAETATPQRPSLVLAGCEAHICLLQTALQLLDEEAYDVWVVTDACGSRTERNRDAAFDRLAAAGAELVTTEMALFEWLETAEHPQFKHIQALVK